MASKPHPPLMKKHSQTDLISRLKSRKILGVGGEDDDGEVHRSKVRLLQMNIAVSLFDMDSNVDDALESPRTLVQQCSLNYHQSNGYCSISEHTKNAIPP